MMLFLVPKSFHGSLVPKEIILTLLYVKCKIFHILGSACFSSFISCHPSLTFRHIKSFFLPYIPKSSMPLTLLLPFTRNALPARLPGFLLLFSLNLVQVYLLVQKSFLASLSFSYHPLLCPQCSSIKQSF